MIKSLTNGMHTHIIHGAETAERVSKLGNDNSDDDS